MIVKAILITAALLWPGGVWADRDHDTGPEWGQSHHEHYSGVHGAPGPIAGAGVPIVVALGGLWLYRRWRRRAR